MQKDSLGTTHVRTGSQRHAPIKAYETWLGPVNRLFTVARNDDEETLFLKIMLPLHSTVGWREDNEEGPALCQQLEQKIKRKRQKKKLKKTKTTKTKCKERQKS